MSIIIPQGGTFLQTLRKSFIDVPILEGNGIATRDFLEAAESLTSLFGSWISVTSGVGFAHIAPDLLGSVAFTPVKNDMLGNIKVRSSRNIPWQKLMPPYRNYESDN